MLNIGGILDFGAGNGNVRTLAFSITDTAQVTATYLQLKTKNLARTDIVFSGGTLVLTSDNSIRGRAFVDQNVNITAGVGEFTLTANSTDALKTLATKCGSDLFMLDGVRMTVVADGSDIAALNAELATIAVVSGKYLQISEGVGTQTLSVIPEPATFGLMALIGGGLLFARRTFSL